MHLLFIFLSLTLLHPRKAKTSWSFGPSECNRVRRGQFIIEFPPVRGEDSFLHAKTVFWKASLSKTNVSLKFQMLILIIRQYFLLKKCEKLLQCKSFSHFINKKYKCIWL